MKSGLICVTALAVTIVAGAAFAEPPSKPATDQSSQQGASAGTTKPDVATLLFSNPQWAKAPVGSTLRYLFTRKVAKSEYGDSYEDHITMKLGAGDQPDARTAEVVFFTGVRRKPAGPFASDKQNPVLLLVLENNIQELSKLFKANPRYLKTAIRKAWRDNATIENVPVEVNGTSVPGTRISVTPFVGDAQADKMKGLSDIVYVVEIADSVPGNLAKVDIHAPASGSPVFSEVLRFQSEDKP